MSASGEPGDRDLVARVLAQRDDRAFRALYARHTPMLYALALRLTGERREADDVVHDTWVRGVEALPGFAWRSTLRTWLTAILINRVRELWRDGRDDTTVDETHIDDELAAPDRLDNILDVDPIDFERAMAAMPPRYREVIVLHDIEGYAHHEIAELLGVHVGTSKSQLTRGRRWLRNALTPVKERTP